MFDFTKPKWIIQDNQLRMGRVVNHSDLAIKNQFGGTPDVKGGGIWHYDKETNTLYLYSKSYQYGQVSVDDFEDIWVRPSMENATIIFSTSMSFEDAKKNGIIVQDLNKGELL